MNSAQIIALGSNLAPSRGHKFYMGLYRDNIKFSLYVAMRYRLPNTELPTVTAELELFNFSVKFKSVPTNMFSLIPFRLLRFRPRLNNCYVFGMFCQPLQQTTYMYLVSIDKFWALIG